MGCERDDEDASPAGAASVTPSAPLAVVRPDWVDSYGHMNMAFYLAVFDMATDALWPRLGLGAPFKKMGLGTFAAETWVNYVREVREGMPLACESEVLAFDGKRLLGLHRMLHAAEGWLAAENEVLYLCVDLSARRRTSRSCRPAPESARSGRTA